MNDKEYNLCVNDIYCFYAKYIRNYLDKKYNKIDEITCVLSVPSFYTNKEIGVLYKIFESCNYNHIYIIPEYLSAALTYGYENNSYINDYRIICIVDMGYLNTSYSILRYDKVYFFNLIGFCNSKKT